MQTEENPLVRAYEPPTVGLDRGAPIGHGEAVGAPRGGVGPADSASPTLGAERPPSNREAAPQAARAQPIRERWHSFEAMRAGGADIEQDPQTGDWYRRVPRVIDRRVLPDGSVQTATVMERRHVALSAAEARAMLPRGDFWVGWTWARDGVKLEKDYPENEGATTRADVVWATVDAPPPATPPTPAKVAATRAAAEAEFRPVPSGRGSAAVEIQAAPKGR